MYETLFRGCLCELYKAKSSVPPGDAVIPNVVFTVAWDLFPRTLNISSTMVLLFCSSLVNFCKKRECIKMLYGGDVSENDDSVKRYISESICNYLLEMEKNPEQHVLKVCKYN